ncbi:hypothetical protein [Leeuwenhoekiella nanhaiensis]|uniref:Uncharacterized protein n=1 Tax=Leeuwenhoekiella nanhaiensis TaxID=1655491 RepID=A0A2G1VMU4_9FLAO|nr:hypothetical protein [Leeuwenhoekiella nanhaiensis]PHQ28096.1 hypothetical protein CJ305_16910 [Leeuwenhoekiella nanhaiensis]
MKTKYERILWLILTILFVTLIIKMTNLPSAYGFWFPFILSSLFCLVAIGIGGIIMAGLLKAVLNYEIKFWNLFSITSLIITTGLHVYFHYPPLKIIVPNNFAGEVTLVVDPNNKKTLIIDSDGTGYITESIYSNSSGDKKPNVYFQNGEKISENRIVGYDSLFFYGRGNYNGKYTLKFEIKRE